MAILQNNQPKYLQIAAAIESELATGSWDGLKMPSVRGIASKHDVSIVTASRALQVLRDKGLIQTIERSGCYRIPPPEADRWALCLHTTPGAWQKHTHGMSRGGFESLARREPMHLEIDPFDIRAGRKLSDFRKALDCARHDGIQGVFLLPSRIHDSVSELELIFLDACREANIPVVLLDRNLRMESSLRYDLISVDDVSAANTCTEHLYQSGRKRIGIVCGTRVSSHLDRIAGYLHAHHNFHEMKVNSSQVPPIVIWQDDDPSVNTKTSYTRIANQILKDNLDGVICYQDYLAMGIILEMLQRDRKVPKDLAVIGFENLPIGESFAIGLTTYDYPAEAIAEQAIRQMKHRIKYPDSQIVKIRIPGKLIIRDSA